MTIADPLPPKSDKCQIIFLTLPLGRVKFVIPNLDNLFCLAYPEILSKIRLGWFFAQKLGLGFGRINIFIHFHSLGLAFPEILSSIGLMVEAVDTVCSMGQDLNGDGWWLYRQPQLKLLLALAWLLLRVWLRFVKKYGNKLSWKRVVPWSNQPVLWWKSLAGF